MHGHPQVRHDGVEGLLLEPARGLGARVAGHRLVTALGERVGERLDHGEIVIDDEDTRARHGPMLTAADPRAPRRATGEGQTAGPSRVSIGIAGL